MWDEKKIYAEIGRKIKDLRTANALSQEALAREVKTTANTISRWETGTYKPTIPDLHLLSEVLGVPMTAFFPEPEPSSRMSTLLSASHGLSDDDLKEVIRYVLYRRATSIIQL